MPPQTPKSTDIVARYNSSPFLYGADSKDRTLNPNFHPPVCLRRDGKFTDESGRVIQASAVPEYVREAARVQVPPAPKEKRRELTLAEAMEQSVPGPAPAVKRGRGRPRKAA